ncbi:MAG: phosphatidylinositol mannoside acyltransferase [Actinobacteria bacterium]|nr:phosphatidylinositol mannoside acyltransferase [Actinomycetota bacterium]
MSQIADQLTSWGFGAGWSVVRRMPDPVAYATFERLADTAWARRGPSVRRLESNLRRVVGPEPSEDELRVLSRAGMRSYLRYWCDAFRLPGWSRERIVESIGIIDDHHLADGLATGRGVVVALPHMGNWDHAGAWATLAHSPVVTVAERLKPEDLYEKFLAFRRGLGMDVIPLTGGEPPFPYLADKLKGGALVALLGDRDLGRSGVPVQFFGAKAKMPAGPAALAVDTGAVLITAQLYLEDGRNWVRFQSPVDVPQEGERSRRIFRTTQLVADKFEEGIGARPADWHMMQRLWVDDLDPAKAPKE